MRINRIPTGIEGLDEMIDGGIPEGHIVVLRAPTGGGKTTAGLQFIHSSVQKGLTCMLISSSMDEKNILRMAKNYGWNFEEYVEEGLISIKFIPPIITEVEPLQRAIKYNRTSPEDFRIEVISEQFEGLIRHLTVNGSKIVVIDSLSEFLLLAGDEVTRRGYLLHIYNIIRSNRATALINIEEELFTEEAEILADGVIHFQRIQSLKRGEVNYLVEIVKMRLSNHSKEIREYKITSNGIKIFSKYGVI